MAEDFKNNKDDEIIEVPDLDEEESGEDNVAETDQELEKTSEPEAVVETRETVTEKIIVKTSKEKSDKGPEEKHQKNKKDQTNKTESANEATAKPDGKLKKLWLKCVEKKKLTIPLFTVVLVLILAAIPLTRYAIAGIFIKKSVNVSVLDSKTGKPVSEADVTIAGKTARTDGNGLAIVAKVKVGPSKILVTKKYYKDTEQSTTVTITGSTKADLKIEATGRQVPVKVTNIIDDSPILNAQITSGESTAKTDSQGQTTIVLPPNQELAKATIERDGFNNNEVDIKITEQQSAENEFTLTPAGKVYFLSKLSGKIDVVKTNLDGTDRQVVFAGSGNEDEYNTSLLASRDWKYVALHARHDEKAKLYLIETANDQISTIDEGDADFVPVGWYNQNFVFQVSRTDHKLWQPNGKAIKSFNAETKNLITLDQTGGEGTSDIDYATEGFGQIYILDNELVYAKYWQADYYSGGKIYGKKNTINRIRPDGSDKKVIKEFDAQTAGNSYIDAKLYEPQEVYFQITNYTQQTYYEYEDGQLKEDPKVTIDEFNRFYPTFLISPSGSKTFWSESRDGKNTLFIGDRNADDEREIAKLSDFQTYGWFTEEYLLESKNGSELYISSLINPDKSIKISDYHRPRGSFTGYGYGYGGL